MANDPALTDAERHQLLAAWNDTRADYPKDCSIHELFQAQAARTPDAAAAVFQDSELTYGELNRRANQLAHHLRTLGVGPEKRVGICMERSLDMLVGILGILKAGGTYVPLDPAYPQDRLSFIVRDARPWALLTLRRLAGNLEHITQVICLDADWDVIAQAKEADPASEVCGDHPAYVIHTSGSTGKPKGVLIPQRALVNHSTAIARYYDLRPDDRILQFASINFDVAAEELFPSWLSGAAVVLRRGEIAASLTDLTRFVDEARLTVLNLPAPFWHEWVAHLDRSGAETPAALRLMIVGSEQVLPESLATWKKMAGERVRWYNAYGPTEATITTTIYDPAISPEHQLVHPIPIGRSIANTQMYLLNEQLQPVPVGAPGELYIGGDCLARGYLDRPDLTAETFVPDPFPLSQTGGSRLYKTGDRACYLPDGNIQFLGRVDYQIKLRGFRIELGEIEAVLSQHPAVQEAVVVVKEEQPGGKRLVAYVVASSGQTSRAGELRPFLKEQLPEYMLPSSLVTLDALPLTPSGKVDRRALFARQDPPVEPDRAFVAPRTLDEEMLAGIWAQLFGLQQVGVHDNFFELGGHSLLATQAIARIRETFQVEIAPTVFFEKPTIAGLAESIKQSRAAEQPVSFPPIQPAPREGYLPLSFPQEAIWFLSQLTPGLLAYNTQVGIHFKGRLDVAALERTWTEIARRHEVFRTTFPTLDGRPTQVIHPPQAMTIPVVDMQLVHASRQEKEAERLTWGICRRPFDITQIHLIRWVLLRLGEQEHVLVIVEHHFVHDGWSLALLLREMKTIYAAFSMGRPSPLPDLPIQFADFCVWQRQLMQGRFLESQLAYWKNKLADPSPLDLPTDHPRPNAHSFQGRRQLIELAPDLYKSLKGLSRREGATLFMTMLATFQTLLYRYTGQPDILIGSDVANRRLHQTEGLIGMITNTVVLRTDLRGAGNPTFRELMRRVRETVLETFAHQDLPFERLVVELQPERDPGRNPLFQVAFAFHDSPVPDLDFPELTGRLRYLHNDSAKFDLVVIAIPRSEQRVGQISGGADEGILMEWEYSTDLFEAETIARMAGHYQTLLQGIVRDPGQRLGNLPLLTEAERRKLLIEWNVTRPDQTHNRCLHQLFEAQAERTPDTVAVVMEDQLLTYAALNRRANQLAHHLRTLGANIETPVGICMERSVEMVVGVLGIFKAGGAHVPLDPAYPGERLAFMLADTQAPIVLSQQRLIKELLPKDHKTSRTDGGRVICLDTEWDAIAEKSEENPISGVTPDNLAYIIYTSGSTGLPKGVCCCHRGVVNLLTDLEHRQPLSVGDGYSAWTSINFDVSVYEILAALWWGGTLYLPTEQVRSDTQEFIAWLAARHIRTAYIPPFMLKDFSDWLKQNPGASSLHRLLVGVEPIPEQLLRAIYECIPGLHIVDGYGPTEASIASTLYSVDPTLTCIRNTPIGRPVQNTSIYLLDQHLQPVPVGVPGILYVGGFRLARGYLNRPELTAEAFIPNPFPPPQAEEGREGGTRLYRTGDLARYLPDGNIEFLGRLDYQVKVRGFRIELGEIEAVLSQHPAVREVIVLVHDAQRDSTGGQASKHLVAYVVSEQDQSLEDVDLRSFLRAKLPDYMVPTVFVILEAFPMLPNGKVDRRALPTPDSSRLEMGGTFVAPRSLVEETVAKIWSQILGQEQVGIYDDFFALGGHSLLAAQIASRLRDTFQIEFPLRNLFDSPTVAELALVIEDMLTDR